MTTRQLKIMMQLQSLGARVSEALQNHPQRDSIMLDYKEFKNTLDFYLSNRVSENG